MARKIKKPTPQQFGAYQAMFDHFNKLLFKNQLKSVILNFSRRASAHGFFAPERWSDENDKHLHEISINPEQLKRPVEETAATLVHEMVHLWQQDFGNPSRTGYHNKEWAAEMNRVGLKPVSLDQPGHEVGQKVTHEVVLDGAFAVAFKKLPPVALLPFRCDPEVGRAASLSRNKSKYTCPSCSANVWGRPELAITCDACGEPFEEEIN